MSTDRARQIMERSDQLATLTMVEGQVTRPYATSALWAARDQLAIWMQEAGLSTRTDSIGNLFGRYEAGDDVSAPKTLVIGGHFDSVVDAGRYDGTLGILSGIATVQRLSETNTRLPFAVEVVAIADEEGNRFHTSFLGSSPLVDKWDPTWLDLMDDDGVSLRDAVVANGEDPDQIGNDAYDPTTLLGFIELHIEQGPVLQAQDLPIAVVSSITGSHRATIVVEGTAGHAGTVPMDLRRDALTAAAEVVLAVEAVGLKVPDLVATVGRMEVAPGAPNVIPGRVEFTLDLRHADSEVRQTAIDALRKQAMEIASRRGVDINWIPAPGFDGVTCDAALSSLLTEAISDAGYAPLSLFSGAGHDALTFASITPVAMLFLRCKDGISHNPGELIKEADVAVALQVMNGFVDKLADR